MSFRSGLIATATVSLLSSLPAFAGAIFTPNNLVVSVEGNGPQTPGVTYTDNQAAPLSLYEYSTSGGSLLSSLVLPQTNSGSNFAVSGEYGSSSEGLLNLSGNGLYLTIMGYGVNAAAYNGNQAAYEPASQTKLALGQTASIPGTASNPALNVPRVVALIDSNGNVNSSTAIAGVFDQNNPRSAYTVDGQHIYISGQGNSPDLTGGVFYTTLRSTTATAITGADTNGMTSNQDTRYVQVYNGQLYVSADSKEGSGNNRSFVGILNNAGTALPTSLAFSGNGATEEIGTGSTSKLVLTTNTANNVNQGLLSLPAPGKHVNPANEVNLSPEEFFFASPSVVYIADSGSPKQDSAPSNDNGSGLGDGGLQKWVNSLPDGSGAWSIEYTLSAGLNLVANTSASGTTGLLGLTGEVVGDSVELFATNATVGDEDQTWLFDITDSLAATTLPSAAAESFSILETAPADTNFKGVAFAPTADVPTPEPGTLGLFGIALAGLCTAARRRCA